MSYTISAHFGKRMSRNHNIRSPKVVGKEKHISKDGYFRIIEDKTLRQAYHDLFGEAVAEYNAKQTRRDRLVTDYLSKVKDHYTQNPDRHTAPSQEVIFTIGNVDDCPSVEESEKVLTDFLNQWKEKNKNVYVYGAYFHADEPGAAPHLHVDYILFKDKNKRGLSRQVSQIGALREMGYENDGKPSDKGKFVTAQTQWQTATRELLRTVARDHGLDVQDKGVGKNNKRAHLDTELFKKETSIKDREAYIADLVREKEQLTRMNQELREERRRSIELLGKLEAEQSAKADELAELNRLKEDNRRLIEDNTYLARGFEVMKEVMKGYTITVGDKQVSLWNKVKGEGGVFHKMGKKVYDRFMGLFHNPYYGGNNFDMVMRDDRRNQRYSGGHKGAGYGVEPRKIREDMGLDR